MGETRLSKMLASCKRKVQNSHESNRKESSLTTSNFPVELGEKRHNEGPLEEFFQAAPFPFAKSLHLIWP